MTTAVLERCDCSRGIPEQDDRFPQYPPGKGPLYDFVRPRCYVPGVANKHWRPPESTMNSRPCSVFTPLDIRAFGGFCQAVVGRIRWRQGATFRRAGG